MGMRRWVMVVAAAAGVAGCAGEVADAPATPPEAIAGQVVEVEERVVPSVFAAAGTARPMQEASLATKLMGTVLAVHVREGEAVRRGQLLVEIDTRDVDARRAQVAASIEEAEAVLRDAEVQADRFRKLHAEGAAPKVQLDAAETGLARARAAVASGRAAAREVRAVAGYGEVRAPFDGVITRRFVDPGAFAAPGMPLVAIEDDAQLRVSVSAPPDTVRSLKVGDAVGVELEGVQAEARIEGVVRAAGNLYTVNAVVPNPERAFLSGSAARLALEVGERPALLVPAGAVVREGDLTGLHLRIGERDELRWVRIGRPIGDRIEVLSGVSAGDRVVVPAAVAVEN